MNQLANIDTERDRNWLALYENMLLIRRAEERLCAEAQAGTLPGTVHSYIGQEASAVGVCSLLREDDYITSTHRGHGHYLAKGGDLDAMFAEIWGRADGICKGMGGSMHVADVSRGILGANGIVGGGLAISTGAAFGAQLEGKGKIAVCFFGDGAANQGVFMESMNIATAWSLPVIFLCENNGLSEFTVSSQVTGGDLIDRARAFGMFAEQVDGNDVIAVQEVVARAIDHARAGNGPCYVETTTYRIRGHLEAEDLFLGGGRYRTPEEIAAWQTAERDPILRFARRLIEETGLSESDLTAVEEAVAGRVEAAVQFANASGPADVELPRRVTFADQQP
ncbi:MAG: thiamine pyrophosphate-dependent dehydrogenase E1 component subunit alpha [Sphingobium sp.]|nr:thiamine pyrophosphate-dependent dehydrogenase E1 component subunit alpha [Sphingobium sp.]